MNAFAFRNQLIVYVLPADSPDTERRFVGYNTFSMCPRSQNHSEEIHMKRHISLLMLGLVLAVTANAQRGTTFTGTAVIYGSGFNTRTITRPFTLVINRRTSAETAAGYVRTLERGGQDDLLREIDDNDLGRFSLGNSVGVPVNAVLIDRDGDETRIRAIFARWIGFGELRSGLRSVDYPFGYVEIRLKRSGRGDGTIIPAARIRFKNANTIEVEDFGTFPGRLMGVRMRGAQLP